MITDIPEPDPSELDPALTDLAEKVLNGERLMEEFLAEFEDRSEALAYYGWHVQRKYSSETVGRMCGLCGSGVAFDLAKYDWQAVTRYRVTENIGKSIILFPFAILGAIFFLLHIPLFWVPNWLRAGGSALRFETIHGVCRSCRRGMTVRHGIAGFIVFVFGFAIVVALCLFIGYTIASIAAAAGAWTLEPKDLWSFVPIALSAFMSVAALYVAMHRLAEYVEVPPALRHIGRRPVCFFMAEIVKGRPHDILD